MRPQSLAAAAVAAAVAVAALLPDVRAKLWQPDAVAACRAVKIDIAFSFENAAK